MERDVDGVLTVRFHTDGGPCVFTGQTHEDLPEALERISMDAEDHGIVLTGTGDSFMDQIDGASLGDITDPLVWEMARAGGLNGGIMQEDGTTTYEISLTHFIVSADVERSARFYSEVLGGRLIRSGEPSYVVLANSAIIINVGGGPTDDKPTVTLEPPPDPDRTSSFLNIRVSDIQAVYTEWSARGALFLTPPKQHQTEFRCYMRDPDGHLIEVGQTTLPGGWNQFLVQP